MNLTHVLAFHRVAVAGSFTLAARLSGVSQPTLSAQVRSLEKSAGVPLFERIGRRIELTRHGEELFDATIKLSAALDDVGHVLSNLQVGLQGHLRISADSAIHVIPILAELKQQTPTFSFSLKTENSAKVIDHVLTDEADVGVAEVTSVTKKQYFALAVGQRLGEGVEPQPELRPDLVGLRRLAVAEAWDDGCHSSHSPPAVGGDAPGRQEQPRARACGRWLSVAPRTKRALERFGADVFGLLH